MMKNQTKTKKYRTMKYIVKNLRIAGLLTILGTIVSCTELYDTSYTDIVAGGYTPTVSDIGSLVGPAYGGWRDVLFSKKGYTGLYLSEEISSDILCVAYKPYGFKDGDDHRRMHEHTWSATQVHVKNLWGDCYKAINNCNRIILLADQGVVTDPAFKAEIQALRASYYWVLCDNYGNVPIVDRYDVEEGFLPDQKSRKEVYTWIVSQLESAIPYLPEDKTATYARFNKWAAYTLLAKVYLNAEVYSGEAQWDKCIEACNKVIESNLYNLEPNLKTNFLTHNETSKEIIFNIPYDHTYAPGLGIAAWTMLPQNQKTYKTLYGGWGGLTSIPQFINTFDKLDKRYTEGWMMGQQYAFNGDSLKCEYGVLKGQPLQYVNELPGIDSTQEIHSFRIDKYEIEIGCYANNEDNDMPLFRYADVLMMKAECLLRTGHADDAAAIVTQVRLRSFPDNPDHATVTGAQLQMGSSYDYGLRNYHTSTEEGGADIQYGRMLDELGWEFAAEGHRRQDLVRFGIYTTKSWLSHSPQGDYRSIFPIPLQELDKNTKLQQNPGY
jgi:starch-binding outer membrane protein, SusD/RagB family